MDIYRVTRTDPKGRRYPYRKPGTPEVRFGTKRRASAIVREVKQVNKSRAGIAERYPQYPYCPASVTVERAPVDEWTDVTAEFLGEDQ